MTGTAGEVFCIEAQCVGGGLDGALEIGGGDGGVVMDDGFDLDFCAGVCRDLLGLGADFLAETFEFTCIDIAQVFPGEI